MLMYNVKWTWPSSTWSTRSCPTRRRRNILPSSTPAAAAYIRSFVSQFKLQKHNIEYFIWKLKGKREEIYLCIVLFWNININKFLAQRPELSSLSQHSAAWSVCPSQVLFQIIILVTRSSSWTHSTRSKYKYDASITITHPPIPFQRSPCWLLAPPVSACLGSPAPLWSWQSLLTNPRGKKNSCVLFTTPSSSPGVVGLNGVNDGDGRSRRRVSRTLEVAPVGQEASQQPNSGSFSFFLPSDLLCVSKKPHAEVQVHNCVSYQKFLWAVKDSSHIT